MLDWKEEMYQDMKEEAYRDEEHERKLRTDWDYALEHMNEKYQVTEAIEIINKAREELVGYGWVIGLKSFVHEF